MEESRSPPAPTTARQQERDDDRQNRGIGEETPERQIEGVEPEVLAELRIRLAEITAVEEHLHGPPRTLADEPREQAEQHRHTDEHRLAATLDELAVHGLRALRIDVQRLIGAMPVRQPQGQENDAADDEADEQEQHDPGHPRGGENGPVPHLPEPFEVDDDIHENWNEQGEEGENHHDGDEPLWSLHPAARPDRACGQGVS